MFDDVVRAFDLAKRQYDRNEPEALQSALRVGRLCLETLIDDAELSFYGNFRAPAGPVPYSAATYLEAISRPYRDDLFISSLEEYDRQAVEFLSCLRERQQNPELVAQMIYTVMTGFCLCFDLWKRGSRKTPGTFFEVMVGSAAKARLPGVVLGKHVRIENLPGDDVDALVDVNGAEGDATEALQGNSVATDLVITHDGNDRAAVIPLKITTRERIVQPFAHQRILSSAYPGKYESFIACISEVQRDGATQSVKQICVPGTVALFQKHMAAVKGLYYADIPERYGRADVQAILPVKTIGSLLDDVSEHLDL